MNKRRHSHGITLICSNGISLVYYKVHSFHTRPNNPENRRQYKAHNISKVKKERERERAKKKKKKKKKEKEKERMIYNFKTVMN